MLSVEELVVILAAELLSDLLEFGMLLDALTSKDGMVCNLPETVLRKGRL